MMTLFENRTVLEHLTNPTLRSHRTEGEAGPGPGGRGASGSFGPTLVSTSPDTTDAPSTVLSLMAAGGNFVGICTRKSSSDEFCC